MGVAEASPEQTGQLSIFEVDPNSISIGPMASATTVETAAPAPSWSGPEWSNIELDTRSEEVEEYRGNPPSTPFQIDLAPLELRLMAATIDFALTVGLVCAGAVGIAGHMAHSPAVKAAEIERIRCADSDRRAVSRIFPDDCDVYAGNDVRRHFALHIR